MALELDDRQARSLSSFVGQLDEEERPKFIKRFRGLSEDNQAKLIDDVGQRLDANKREEIIAEGEQRKAELLAESPQAKKQLAVQEKIKERGQLLDNIGENLGSQSVVNKILGVAQAVGVPFQSIESGIANAMIAVQEGKDIGATIKDSAAGFSLQKQGEFGDVLRGAGVPEPLAATGGLILGIGGPAKIISKASKTLKGISRMSDKGIEKAGKSLVNATQSAKSHAGGELNKVFAKVDQVAVEGKQLVGAINELPKVLIREIENQFGKVADLAKVSTVGQLRQVKQFIGGFRPGAFGKGEKGLAELVNDKKINKGYAMLKTLLGDSVRSGAKGGGKQGEKVAKVLLDMEDGFAEVARASSFIKKTVVDPTLREATKGGVAAGKLAKEGDVTIRRALTTIKGSGKQAKKEINIAVRLLEKFNKDQALFRTLSRTASAIAFGGAAGAIGGKILQSSQERIQQ